MSVISSKDYVLVVSEAILRDIEDPDTPVAEIIYQWAWTYIVDRALIGRNWYIVHESVVPRMLSDQSPRYERHSIEGPSARSN